MDVSNIYGLDFETYGDVDLPKHGLDRYVNGAHFRPLIGCVERADLNPWSGANSESIFLDFVNEPEQSKRMLQDLFDSRVTIAAHNAGFELAVIKWLGLNLGASKILDSAVVARAKGAGGSLEAAAPQLLGVDKLEMGHDLIKLFSIPGEYQLRNESDAFDPQIIKDNPTKWEDFARYCAMDARLSAKLVQDYTLTDTEWAYADVTQRMNQTGWKVDLDLVQLMQQKYEENLKQLVDDFRHDCDAKDLNLNSLPQLKQWCADRGIKATSFDEKNVAKMMKTLRNRLESTNILDPRDVFEGYRQVYDLLNTKRQLGGSSLKKLQVILDTTGPDGRLKDQYLHCGAGQTLRTTGRSVQMQNLKRIGNPADMENMMEMIQTGVGYISNETLASNLRQVFTASHPDGALIVGDFSSVESRGLAWIAGESWKLHAYREGRDLYKVLASKIFGTLYENITKEERQIGKVGELSCGYGAGPGAVQEFATNMGVELSEGEASKLVYDWRQANPNIVELWATLDTLLKDAVSSRPNQNNEFRISDGYVVRVMAVSTPDSLLEQIPWQGKPGAQSIELQVWDSSRQTFLLRRVFHGAYSKGRSIVYYKPSARKTGDLWVDTYINPKTKREENYTIYGGKLAGILTQSLCREIFFQALTRVDSTFADVSNVAVVGQFHDEIVLDWTPPPYAKSDDTDYANSKLNPSLRFDTKEKVIDQLHADMTSIPFMTSFPMGAEIKSDYRYTK